MRLAPRELVPASARVSPDQLTPKKPRAPPRGTHHASPVETHYDDYVNISGSRARVKQRVWRPHRLPTRVQEDHHRVPADFSSPRLPPNSVDSRMACSRALRVTMPTRDPPSSTTSSRPL